MCKGDAQRDSLIQNHKRHSQGFHNDADEKTADVVHDGGRMSESQRLLAMRMKRQVRDNLQEIVYTTAPQVKRGTVSPPPVADARAQKLIYHALEQNSMLNSLKQSEMKYFVDFAEPFKVSAGQDVITQGETGDYFYVVDKGNLEILVNGDHVGDYTNGSSFGELALMSGAPRAATIKAITACVLWRMDRDTFRFAMATSTKAHEESALECLRQVSILEGISEVELESVSHAVVAVHFNPGDQIIHKGDEGNIFYMIQSGQVLVKEIGANFSDVPLGKGQYFGERALETGDVRGATIVAAEPCTLLALAREDFEQILGPLRAKIDSNHNKRILESIDLLSGLSEDERHAASAKFVERTFPKGRDIVKQGEADDSFYVIKEGHVSLETSDQDEEIEDLGPGKYFNLRALLEDDATGIATYHAKTNCSCFVLMREDFEAVVTGDFKSLATKAYHARLAEVNSAKQKRIPKEQLIEGAALGQGTFGRVKLVQDRVSKEVFALKVLHKKEVVEYKQQDNVMNEKNVMLRCHHPFILALHNTYRDEHRLYLLLEYCNGGELFTVLHTRDRDGVPATSAKFYCGCCVLALAYLLERSIIYRDLKPENMLVDSRGFVKLIDFGFAKECKGKAFTLCGTPEYMAPEIILGRGYNISVDWWALGILAYECLAGYSPFAGRDQNAICRNIVNRSLNFPKNSPAFDSAAKDLISGLLMSDAKERLASGPSGAAAVKNHAWFKAVNWHTLTAKECKAPWIPKVTAPDDTRFFDGYGVVDEVDANWVDPAPGWDENF